MAGAFFVLGDLAQIRTCCYTPTQIGLNVTHWYCYATTGLSCSVQDFATQMDIQLQDAYKHVLPVTARWRGVGATRLNPARTLEAPATGNDGPGVAGADLGPTQVAGMISSYAGLAGPRYRGRLYIPFPPQSASTASGAPTIAYIAALSNVITAYGLGLTVAGSAGTASFSFVIRHRPGFTFSVVEVLYPRGNWGTQRRRGMYGRENILPF